MVERLATICARGGSKGVAGKNVRALGGKPLIAHAIEQARASGVFATVAVSSDSARILDIGREWGADLLVERPAEMADDKAPKLPAIRHCATAAEESAGHAFDVIVDLAVTSPLRAPEDIVGAVELLERTGAAIVLSASPARHSPYFAIVEVDDDGTVHYSKAPPTPLARRQDAPPCYALNGAVYAWTSRALFAGDDCVIGPHTRLYVMAEERSVDIDSELDFRLAELLMAGTVGSNPRR